MVKTLYLLFSIIFFSEITSAISLNAFQDSESPSETAYDSSESATDSRVDSNGDGKLDHWKVKDKDLEIVSTQTENGKKFTIQNEINGQTVTAEAQEKNGIVSVTSVTSSGSEPTENFLSSAKEISPIVSPPGDLCGAHEQRNKVAYFNADLKSADIRERVEELWSKECLALFHDDKEKKNFIEQALLDVVTVEKKRKSNDILNCLDKVSKDVKGERSALVLTNARGEIADFYNGILKPGYFSCKKSNEDGISVGENGKFIISVKDAKGFAPPEKVYASFYAGLLKKWGASGKFTDKLAQACISQKYEEGKVLFVSSIDSSLAHMTSQTSMSNTAKVASAKEIAGINAKLAETKVNLPSAAEASPRALAQISATQGAEAATTVARSQSSGLLGVANTVMGAVNTPASAASGRGYSSDSDSSSGSSASSRSPASTRSSSRKTSSNTRVPALRNAKGVGADEEIVEEIDLTRSAQSARRAQQAPSQARNTGGNAQGSSAGNAPRGPASEGGSAPNSELSGGGGGSSGSGASVGAGPASSAGISGGGGGGSAPAARGAAAGRAANNARGPASTATVSQASREEIVTFLGSADYTMAKKKIRDAKFQESLKANDISIIDLSGNSYPPKFKGKTIFLDRGDRFVRQK
ncbi:hypothetical protein D3C87_189960 [compost metagenome]